MSLTINHNLMAMNAARNLAGSFSALGVSTRRLASGLRVSTAADDPAGLAVSELMRSEIATLHQGVRNANDAISMIQVADGALQVIDEKLIRMKELTVQAATGTYNSDQRLVIHSEWLAMRSEIERIAQATDFNGIKLLNNFEDIKIHFGTGNDSNEDYYYVNRQYATIDSAGLGLDLDYGAIDLIQDIFGPNGGTQNGVASGIISFAVIPRGVSDLSVHIDSFGQDDTIEIFTRRGLHVAGTQLSDGVWGVNGVNTVADMNSQVLTQANGFRADASYDGSNLNGQGASFTNAEYTDVAPYNEFSYNDMNIGYSGDGNAQFGGGAAPANNNEYLTINETTEDLVLLVVGNGAFNVDVSWGDMIDWGESSLRTQELAQETLRTMDEAIVRKDKIRAQLGATQNRLENTVTNLQVQAENLQAAESRVRDVDVSSEMTEFTRRQILAQSAVAMLAQANSLPRLAMQLLGG